MVIFHVSKHLTNVRPWLKCFIGVFNAIKGWIELPVMDSMEF